MIIMQPVAASRACVAASRAWLAGRASGAAMSRDGGSVRYPLGLRGGGLASLRHRIASTMIVGIPMSQNRF